MGEKRDKNLVQHFTDLSKNLEFCAVWAKKVLCLIEIERERCKKRHKKFGKSYFSFLILGVVSAILITVRGA